MTQQVAQLRTIIPDSAVAQRIMGFGAEDMQRCYQCGTCSVVCPETPDLQAFPRKEMIWAQWGLTDRLLADGDAWMCHQCNECSIHCPRDAKPGDLMAALRHYQIEQYAAPRWLGRATSSLKNLPLALIPPVALTLLLVLFAAIIFGDGWQFPDRQGMEKEILFEDFIGHWWIDGFSALAVGFALVVAFMGGRRFWQGIQGSSAGELPAQMSFARSLVLTVHDILSHRYFRLCRANKPRGHAHMGIFYGFMLLFLATTMAFFWTTGFGLELSLPAWNPIKLIGNVGGGLLLLGLVWVTWRRLARRKEAGSSSYFDWYFVGILYVLTISGFALEILRYSGAATASYSLYIFHLVFYFMLFTYLPYSKFAHIVYRTLALTHARQTGRTPGTRSPVIELV